MIPVPVADEMSESFLAYSLSVITARAIPDVRDGLKPVQRRILYSMLGMGLRPASPHRKCARVVGDTMGKYHPHGDMAIYEALVAGTRLCSHGDFGRPAGILEVLMIPQPQPVTQSVALLGLRWKWFVRLRETVDFRPTYDGEHGTTVFTGLLPNLLVNGTTGIAVGMATNMPT